MSYKISVIIPTYNAKDYILRSLESIKNQTFDFNDIEVIFVDDYSTDKTRDIITDLSNEYNNVKSILLDKNSGSPSKPRNVGIENSSADYIMFLDNDDFYYPDMCKTLYDTIIKYDVDVVTCRYYIDDSISKIVPKSFLDNKYQGFIKFDSIEECPDFMSSGFPTLVWDKIYRKSVILDNDIEFPVGSLYEDGCFVSKFFINADGLIFLNDFYGYGYNLRVEGDRSTCQTFSQSVFIKSFKGFKILMNLLENNNYDYIQMKSELLIDMVKYYIYCDISINLEDDFLKYMVPYFRKYSLFTRVFNISLPLNIVINIFIKLFGVSNLIPKWVSKLYSLIK